MPWSPSRPGNPTLLLAAIALVPIAPGDRVFAEAPPSKTSTTAPLSTLQRVVRHFDFNQATSGSAALPDDFYRYIAPAEGFPPFGSLQLTAEDAYPGPAANQGSLLFELDGGSMSARVATSVIPVLPLSDYTITARVKTLGLRNSHARMVGWIHDTQGRIIESSRIESRLVSTDGRWEQVKLELFGHWQDAADLVLELQVIQPELHHDAAAEAGAGGGAPRLADIRGNVWFDDVIVAHMPRVTLAMNSASNVVRQPELPQVFVAVNELTSDPLTARLRVFDLDGRAVYDSTFPAPREQQNGSIRIPVEQCGWYRAVLDITSPTTVSRRQWLDFVVLPKGNVRRHADGSSLGVVLPELSAAAMARVPGLIDLLGNGCVMAAAWSSRAGRDADRALQTSRLAMINQLLRQNVDLIMIIDVVPDLLAKALTLETSQVLKMVKADPRQWRSPLDDMLVNFGLEVQRWQLGSLHDFEAFWDNDLDAAIKSTSSSLKDFVPDPRIHTTWLAEHLPPTASETLPGCTVVMPWQLQPSSIAACASDWKASAREVHAVIETLPESLASPRRRVGDAMIRALNAWRGGLTQVSIAAPWTVSGSHESGDQDSAGSVMLDPLFPAWRNLNDQLSGRTVVGEVPLPDGQHCWILRGRNVADSSLVAWTDDGGQSSLSIMTAQLADGAVNVIDAFGNARTIEPRNGLHDIRLSDLPVFIKNVNLELVQFRGNLRVEPDFVPALAKVQEHQLVLGNPWDIAISGTIHLVPDDEWQVSPSSLDFVIKAGGEVRLPFTIVPSRSILAGPKQLQAEVNINADRSYRLSMIAGLTVGLKNIELAASYTTAHNPRTGQQDLVVTQAVTNKGDAPVNLDVHLLADGVGQTRRTIAGLGPGETAVRTFRVPNGAATLTGKKVRVGVSERDGLTRLNHELNITGREFAGARER